MLPKENLGPLEANYRRHYLKWDLKVSAVGFLFLQVPNISFAYSDFLHLKDQPAFAMITLLRVLALSVSVFFWFIARRIKTPSALDFMNLSFTSMLLTLMMVINWVRPHMFQTHFSLDILGLTACYLSFPNRLKWRVLPPALYSVFLGVFIFFDTSIAIESKSPMLHSLALANMMGLFFSNQYHHFRRKKYATTQRLMETQALLKIQANTDPLTGITNRRHFMELIRAEWLRFERYRRTFCLIMMDVDFFKDINDRFGHQAGDKVLHQLASTLKEKMRPVDVIARLGGEEFGIFLPETKDQKACIIAERLRLLIREMEISPSGEPLTFSVSMGLAQVSLLDGNIETTLARADQALYQAKRQGRDQVCMAPHPVAVRPCSMP